MTVRILGHQTLYRDERFFSAFPNLILMPDNTVLLAFRRAPDHRWMLGDIVEEDFNAVDHVHFRSHIAMMRLSADMAGMSAARSLPMDAEAGDQDANLFLTKSGRLIQYGFMWYPVIAETTQKLADKGPKLLTDKYLGAGYLFWGGYSRYSDDGGVSWSDRFFMPEDETTPPQPFKHKPGGPAIRGRMVQLEDGRLLMAGYGHIIKGHSLDAVRFYVSSDDGASWQLLPGGVKHPEIKLQEPALALWPEGKVTAFCRTYGNDDHLMTLTADCGSLAFGEAEDAGIKGHPYDPLVLPDGRLFLVYGYRHDPMGVRARLIEPGQKLADAEEVVIRDDSRSRDTGYPSAIRLEDGRIMIAYYIPDKRGIRGIEGTLVEIE